MTTDVVIRLRSADFIGEDTTTLKIAVEAADEIEHLRETIEQLNIALWGQLKTCRCHDKAVRGE